VAEIDQASVRSAAPSQDQQKPIRRQALTRDDPSQPAPFLAARTVTYCTEIKGTPLSDGGDDISHACKLPAATARVLDWFHIGMRFEQLLLSLRGLRGHARRVRLQGPSRATGRGPIGSREPPSYGDYIHWWDARGARGPYREACSSSILTPMA
jgi:hypothetical protein